MLRSLAVLGMVLSVGCGVAAADSAEALITGTSSDYDVAGTLTLADSPEGLKISGTISGVPPGDHGFHIHSYGQCGQGGKAAGGHYNPKGTSHGLLSADGPEGAHAGDLGNMTVAENGQAEVSLTIPGLTVSGGDYPVAGRAFIVHADPDDFGQPTGNAGGRIGCGVIVITGD